MSQPTPYRRTAAQNWKPIALVAFIAAAFGIYLVGRNTDDSHSKTGLDAPVAESTDSIYPPDLGGAQGVDRVGDAVSSSPRSSRSSVDAVADTAQNSPPNLIPDSMVSDVMLLQAQQQIEFEQMQDDFVTVRSGYGDTEAALRELQSLQAQQKTEAESAPDDEIVIAGGLDGSAVLTVADLRALHSSQQSELESAGLPGDVATAVSFDGSSELTRAEIEALHSRQRIVLESDTLIENIYSAPLSADGSSDVTVDELKELHNRQFEE